MTNAELDAITGEALVLGEYRYYLTRTWAAEMPYVVFVGLNPSTADATENDPTIRKCMRYAMGWGFGGIVMLNLFAFRATDPTVMRKAADPVGPMNDLTLGHWMVDADLVVACWGDYGFERGREFADRHVGRLAALRVNFSGHPAHPLYLPADLRPTPYLARPGEFQHPRPGAQ